MTKLYHYSNNNFGGQIKPKYFNGNFYTSYSAKISNVKRSYFYTDISSFRIEHRFFSYKYLYTTKIDKKTLYNLDSNKIKNFTDIYLAVKKLGYKGIIKDNIVVLFYPIKIIKKEIID